MGPFKYNVIMFFYFFRPTHPPLWWFTVMLIIKNCHFLIPPTHLFDDVILEWSLCMLLWKLFVCVQPSLATYLSLFENDARKFCPRGNKSWEFWHDWNSAIFENCPRLLLDCSVYNNVHNVIHHFQGLFFFPSFWSWS